MTEAPKHDTVLDTGAEQLGTTYARALIAAAQKEGVADQVVQQLGQMVDEYLSQSPQLAASFASPRIDADEKCRVLDRIFGDEFHPILIKFLKVMASRDRLGYVAAVRRASETQLDEMLGRLVATVRTAVPLEDSMRSQIAERLSSLLHREVRLKETVAPDLIGGMVIRIGDTVYDSSVVNRIDKMQKKAKAGFSSQLLKRFDEFVQDKT
ncbi:ATP synthase F1 subunit delta [Novipirellula rosea]|uniref:ATP synthase subunit delta n=1 Tax=Novipirellula rosea TaxID=1031540 RepID=A0ABP8MYM0_9BACT|tara:strand:- start:716 stop:1345 length:630 start_codon:yes stop_codon:yes gene_type:complete